MSIMCLLPVFIVLLASFVRKRQNLPNFSGVSSKRKRGTGEGEGGLVTSSRSIIYVFTIHEIIKEYKNS